jgi:hypothetical protein
MKQMNDLEQRVVAAIAGSRAELVDLVHCALAIAPAAVRFCGTA